MPAISSDEILNYCWIKLSSTVPWFKPTDDLGERQKQLDRFIGHSAARDFVAAMIEDLGLNPPPVEGEQEPSLDEKRREFFEGK